MTTAAECSYCVEHGSFRANIKIDNNAYASLSDRFDRVCMNDDIITAFAQLLLDANHYGRMRDPVSNRFIQAFVLGLW